jgi:hypothetical protein
MEMSKNAREAGKGRREFVLETLLDVLEAIIEEMEATRAWIRDATWKRLDRVTVETLVGGKV